MKLFIDIGYRVNNQGKLLLALKGTLCFPSETTFSGNSKHHTPLK
jgi:hypothetical protein